MVWIVCGFRSKTLHAQFDKKKLRPRQTAGGQRTPTHAWHGRVLHDVLGVLVELLAELHHVDAQRAQSLPDRRPRLGRSRRYSHPHSPNKRHAFAASAFFRAVVSGLQLLCLTVHELIPVHTLVPSVFCRPSSSRQRSYKLPSGRALVGCVVALNEEFH